MKQFLQKTFGLRAWMIVAMLTALVSGAWADEASFVFSEQGYSNGEQVSSLTVGDVTVTFTDGSTATAYYNTGTGIRIYGGGSATFTAGGATITKVALTFSGSSNAPADNSVWSCEGGSKTAATSTEWEGSATSVKIARPTGSGHWRLQKAVVTYTSDGGGGGSTLTDSDFALTNDPVELDFDLYDNASAQVINYTTSSTGAVTIADNDYATFVIDQTNKTITVTPTAKTPSVQTITVNQAADDTYKAGSATFTLTITDSTPKTGGWVLTDLADLANGDVFVIVGDNGSKTYAMTNDKGTSSAPAAYAVTIENDEITSDVADNIKWNISGNATDGYVFYPNGSTTTWLYCTNTNNGVRVGDNAAYDDFTVDNGYLKNKGTSRYVGIYNSTDWRCYTSINSNITGQTFSFYKYEDGSTTPSPRLSADNVEVAYDATSGSVTYAVTNGVDGGVVTAESSESWLTIGTVSDGNVPFTCTTNSDASARTATVTLTYTYNTSETVTKAVTVTQAGNPNVVMTISEARDQGTGSVVTKGIVTSCSGTTAYIQDIDAAICVYGEALTVGDEVKVEGTLTTYKGLLEITSPTVTVLSSGNTVTPEVMTIAEVNASTKQGWLVKIEYAAVTEISGQNTTISQGDNNIVVYGISNNVTYAVNDVMTLTANIGCYNTVQLVNPTDVTVIATPSIELSSNSIEATVAGADGTITVTYKNISDVVAEVFFCDANGDAATYDWITADINGENNNVDYVIDANNGVARTAYFKVYALDDDGFDVFSEIVTVRQEAAPATYALSWTADANATLYVFDNDETNGLLTSSPALVLSDNTVYVSIDITEGFVLDQITVTTTEGAVAITEEEPGVYYSFTMPALATTITVTTKAKPASTSSWVKTDLADLTSGDVFVIVATNADGNYAMSNDNGTSGAPAAVEVTVANDKITDGVADNIKWNISGNATDGYTFYPNGDDESWLYCTNSNNGVRVGTNDNKVFSIKDDYLYHNATSRYLGVYSSQDWRCYTSINNNITGQTFAFYRYAADYERTVTNGYYGTICLPYDGTVIGAELYSIAGKKNNVIYLSDEATLEAGTPYIFKATADKILVTYTGAEAATEAKSVNGLVGSFVSASLATGENLYVLKSNEIRPVGDNVTVGAYKAYINMTAVPEYNSNSGNSNVKSIAIADLTDGINTIDNGQLTMDNAIFNIAGQRINNSQFTIHNSQLRKGIYIVNGKKVVVK